MKTSEGFFEDWSPSGEVWYVNKELLNQPWGSGQVLRRNIWAERIREKPSMGPLKKVVNEETTNKGILTRIEGSIGQYMMMEMVTIGGVSTKKNRESKMVKT